jgi:hypothetical protein
MLSSDLTTQEMDRQKRADLIQKLDELETTLRNGGSDDNDSLKAALARLEAELRAWRGKPQESELSGQQPVRDIGDQRAGGGISPEAEGTLSNAHVIAPDDDRPSHAGPIETAWEGVDWTGAAGRVCMARKRGRVPGLPAKPWFAMRAIVPEPIRMAIPLVR